MCLPIYRGRVFAASGKELREKRGECCMRSVWDFVPEWRQVTSVVVEAPVGASSLSHSQGRAQLCRPGCPGTPLCGH